MSWQDSEMPKHHAGPWTKESSLAGAVDEPSQTPITVLLNFAFTIEVAMNAGRVSRAIQHQDTLVLCMVLTGAAVSGLFANGKAVESKLGDIISCVIYVRLTWGTHGYFWEQVSYEMYSDSVVQYGQMDFVLGQDVVGQISSTESERGNGCITSLGGMQVE
ncbi:hypothetical protein EDC04DRAFT_2614906 [Pisolithus marmoratus]|nr:hypothetical protein EDC04DRAFT_2614906 [Pisolithus marmoratus]